MYMKKFIVLFILLFSISFSDSSAYQGSLPEIYISDVKTKQTTYNPGDTVEGSFIIKNWDDIVATNIYYELVLNGNYKDDVSKTFYSKSNIQGPITLGAKENRVVSFSYKLPRNISGGLGIEVQTSLESGLNMGRGFVRFDVRGSSRLLTIDKVYKTKTSSSTDLYYLAEGMILYEKDEKAFIHLNLSNPSLQNQIIYPQITIYDGAEAKGTLLTEKKEQLVIKANQSIKTKIELPTFNNKPGVYVGKLDLLDVKGNLVSSSMGFRYIIYGQIATINNVVSDKEYGDKGDVINLTINVTGSPFDFDTFRIATSTGSISIKLFNERDILVGDYIESGIDFNQNIAKTYPIKLTKKANSLRAETKVFSETGELLDEMKANLTSNTAHKNSFSIIVPIYIFMILIFVILFLFFIIKKKQKLSIIFIVLLVITVLVGIIFGLTNKANGFTVTYCIGTGGVPNTSGICGGSIFMVYVNTPNPTEIYSPSQKILLDVYHVSNTSAGHFMDYWTSASTPNGDSVSQVFNYLDNPLFIWNESIGFNIGDGRGGMIGEKVPFFSLSTNVGAIRLYATGTERFNKATHDYYHGHSSVSSDAGDYDGIISGYQPYTTVAGIPTLFLYVNPAELNKGESATITWNSYNTLSCSASGDWSGAKSTSGSTNTGPVLRSQTYAMSCLGFNGQTVYATSTVGFSCGGVWQEDLVECTWVPSISETGVCSEYDYVCNNNGNSCNSNSDCDIWGGYFNGKHIPFPSTAAYSECVGSSSYIEDIGSCRHSYFEFNDPDGGQCVDASGGNKSLTWYILDDQEGHYQSPYVVSQLGCRIEFGTGTQDKLIDSATGSTVEYYEYPTIARMICDADKVYYPYFIDIDICVDPPATPVLSSECDGCNCTFSWGEVDGNNPNIRYDLLDGYPDATIYTTEYQYGFDHSTTISIPPMQEYRFYLRACPFFVSNLQDFSVASLSCSYSNFLDLSFSSCDVTNPVTYYGNGNTGGSVPIDSSTYNSGVEVTVADKGNLDKNNNIFTGWNTQALGGGTPRAAGTIFTMPSYPVNLYAQWSPISNLSLNAGCSASQGGADKIYVNRQMQWSVSDKTTNNVDIPRSASTRWSGTSLPERDETTILNNIYTTVGLKTVYATSTWTDTITHTNYTATSTCQVNVILGNDIIQEI